LTKKIIVLKPRADMIIGKNKIKKVNSEGVVENKWED